MKSLLREFDEQAQKAIVVAESLSFDFGHQNVGSEHLLLSLLKIHDNQLKRLLQKYDVNEEVVEGDIKRLFGTNDDQPFYMEYSQSVKRILERSIEYAKDKNQDQVTLNILIISLLKEKESVAYEILQKYHVDVEEVIYLLQEKSAFETPLDQIPTLVNINKKVKTKKYKIIGRENEIDQVCTILSKKEKNKAQRNRIHKEKKWRPFKMVYHFSFLIAICSLVYGVLIVTSTNYINYYKFESLFNF